jgi:hypothetical protein
MASVTEQNFLELVVNTIGFEFMMYLSPSFSYRSCVLYKREHARVLGRNQLFDDGDAFRLAVAVPANDLQRIINFAFPADPWDLEDRYAYVRKAFVQADAKVVIESRSTSRAAQVTDICYDRAGSQ